MAPDPCNTVITLQQSSMTAEVPASRAGKADERPPKCDAQAASACNMHTQWGTKILWVSQTCLNGAVCMLSSVCMVLPGQDRQLTGAGSLQCKRHVQPSPAHAAAYSLHDARLLGCPRQRPDASTTPADLVQAPAFKASEGCSCAAVQPGQRCFTGPLQPAGGLSGRNPVLLQLRP